MPFGISFFFVTEAMDSPRHEMVRTGIVYCSNVNGLINYVCDARELDCGSVFIKIGVNNGK